MEFKDHVTDLLTTIDTCLMYLDLVRSNTSNSFGRKVLLSHFSVVRIVVRTLQTVNYELTKHYLDLVVTYVSIMILLSRIDDRKAVLGLFNFAYELLHGKALASFYSMFV